MKNRYTWAERVSSYHSFLIPSRFKCVDVMLAKLLLAPMYIIKSYLAEPFLSLMARNVRGRFIPRPTLKIPSFCYLSCVQSEWSHKGTYAAHVGREFTQFFSYIVFYLFLLYLFLFCFHFRSLIYRAGRLSPLRHNRVILISVIDFTTFSHRICLLPTCFSLWEKREYFLFIIYYYLTLICAYMNNWRKVTNCWIKKSKKSSRYKSYFEILYQYSTFPGLISLENKYSYRIVYHCQGYNSRD